MAHRTRGRRATRLVLGLLVLALALEGGAWFLHRRSSIHLRPYPPEERAMREAEGIWSPERRFEREMERLYYDTVRYHPYRWYALEPGYRGVFVTTDELGYRNAPSEGSVAGPTVAFLGGSTTFSTTTRQEDSIPARFEAASGGRLRALNLGLGGYSTSAELPALVEALRAYETITHVVFYDGANEVGRHVERLQYGDAEAFYDVLGYPFVGPLVSGVQRRFMGSLAVDAGTARFPYSFYYGKKLLGAAFGVWNPNRVPPAPEGFAPDLEAIAADVVDTYVANVLDAAAVARAHGVEALFLLQPLVFDKPERTEREEAIVARMRGLRYDMERLYGLVYGRIRGDRRLDAVRFHDLSDAFVGVSEPLFYDPCHVTARGNQLVAERVLALLGDEVGRGGGG